MVLITSRLVGKKVPVHAISAAVSWWWEWDWASKQSLDAKKANGTKQAVLIFQRSRRSWDKELCEYGLHLSSGFLADMGVSALFSNYKRK